MMLTFDTFDDLKASMEELIQKNEVNMPFIHKNETTDVLEELIELKRRHIKDLEDLEKIIAEKFK